jgi:predicted nucleotidyltransferase
VRASREAVAPEPPTSRPDTQDAPLHQDEQGWQDRAMTDLERRLPIEELHAFCERWKVRELSVFGSVLTDRFGPDSDVDFLVTWQHGAEWSWFQRFEARRELERIVKRRVDLVERSTVEASRNWIRRQDILQSARTIHAA